MNNASSGPTLFERYQQLLCHDSGKDIKKQGFFDMATAVVRHGLNMAILYAEGDPLGKIGLRHLGRMQDDTFPYRVDLMMSVIDEYDPDITPELKQKWRQILQKARTYTREDAELF